MWKKVRYAELVSVSHQVEELRSVKAAFLRGQRGPAKGGKHLCAAERSHDGRGRRAMCSGSNFLTF